MKSVITQLRQLTPSRALDPGEALSVAERQAHRLRRLLGIRDAYLPEEALMALPGIHVETVHTLDVSGAARNVGGLWVVLLNGNESPTRRRFSLAHEIKHVLDDHSITKLYPKIGNISAHRRAEQICDYFAACLLMPRPLVKRSWTQGLQQLLDLAAHFDVSPQAMRIRLQQLGLVDTARCLGAPDTAVASFAA